MKTKEEIEILRADAVAGDADAQNTLGCAYASGDGVTKDVKEAFVWFERSARLGNKYGQYNTGRYYHHGFGVSKNISLAIEWYEKSANQGLGKAANMLGEIYEKGYNPIISVQSFNIDDITSIEANPEEAFYWYKRGKNSDEQAKYNLARCYELGMGTSKNLYMACKLYRECKDEKAKQKLNSLRQTYNPILDTILRNVEILGNNPYRVLGVWSNSSEREIRANQSKITAMSQVGKTVSFDSDHLIPCDIADFISEYSNKILFLEDGLQKLPSTSRTPVEDHIKECKEILSEWQDVEQHIPTWNIYPDRTAENITNTKNKLSSEKERIKYALFWFCNYTPNDDKALKLLSEHKWNEAERIWFNQINFSACINNAVMQWAVRHNYGAIVSILRLIHKESYRKEFVSVVSNGAIELSEEELSKMFWDALYEFPETELSKYDIIRYGGGEAIVNKNFVTDKDIEYNLNKGFNILKSPLDDLLRNAANLNENDFEKGRSTYNEIIKEAPNILLRIKRLFGEDYYRYKLLCNEIAEKLLDYAIHYNNDNKDEWNASAIALDYANYALTIVKDENLRERCEENISIFKTNKQSATLHYIECKLNEFQSSNVNISEVEKLYSDMHQQVGRIKTLAGNNSVLYKNVSDRVVNEILNIVISICNKHKDASTASSASSIIKKMKEMYMSPETKSRLDKNYTILSNNMVAAIRRGNFGDLGESGKTYSKEENKSRHIRKIWVTISSVAIFTLIWYYLNWNNNFEYFMRTIPIWGYICIAFMSIIVLFMIIMWFMEFQKDPNSTRFDWIDRTHESLMSLSDDIMTIGAQNGKTYSWPFAIPFQLLALAVGFLGFPIRWIAELAVLITNKK